MILSAVRDWETHPWLRGWPVLSWLALLWVLVSTAWACDDAYISFRTIDNLVQGEGLVYNPGERVQAFTHPLWLLLHVPFYALTGNIYYVTIFLSMLLSLGTAAVVARTVGSRLAWGLVPLLIILSKSLTEYSSSGLENPLTHFLLACFAWVYLERRDHPRQLFWLGLLFALLFVNRMDAILLLFPALAWRSWQGRGWRALGLVALGMLPIVAWEAFSVVYYGFPFPNTAYAKLGTGIGNGELSRAGLRYLFDSWKRDPLTLTFIVFGIGLGLRDRVTRPLAVGSLLYLLYVLRIGGDFMSGRFLSAPLLLALVPLLRNWSRDEAWRGWLTMVWAIFLAFSGPTPMLLSRADFSLPKDQLIDTESGIADERAYYYKGTGLLHAFEGRTMPDFFWINDGIRISQSPERVHVVYNLGFLGFYAGPGHYLLDRLALADPLLARLPALVAPDRRPGHYERVLPAGYVHGVRRDSNALADPVLHALYDDLRLITRGPIWSGTRWQAMWRQWTAPRPDLSAYSVPTTQTHRPGDTTSSYMLYPNQGLLLQYQPGGDNTYEFKLKGNCRVALATGRDGHMEAQWLAEIVRPDDHERITLSEKYPRAAIYPIGDCGGVQVLELKVFTILLIH